MIYVLGGKILILNLHYKTCFCVYQLVLGQILLPCFNVSTSKAVPCRRMNLKRHMPYFMDTNTAEAGTLQLELRDLSRSSGFLVYEVFCLDILIVIIVYDNICFYCF